MGTKSWLKYSQWRKCDLSKSSRGYPRRRRSSSAGEGGSGRDGNEDEDINSEGAKAIRNKWDKKSKNNSERSKLLEFSSNRPKSLSEPSYTGTKNVFISFSMRDEAQLKLMRHQAKDDRNELKFRDYSIKEPFDSKWKSQTKERMKLSSTTVCLIGHDTHTREAVNWELKQAYKLGHKVVGVRLYRDANHNVPQLLRENKGPIINWNLGDLMEQLNSV